MANNNEKAKTKIGSKEKSEKNSGEIFIIVGGIIFAMLLSLTIAYNINSNQKAKLITSTLNQSNVITYDSISPKWSQVINLLELSTGNKDGIGIIPEKLYFTEQEEFLGASFYLTNPDTFDKIKFDNIPISEYLVEKENCLINNQKVTKITVAKN